MQTGLEIGDLKGRKNAEWVRSHLPAEKLGDADAEEIDRLLVDEGLSPEAAARRLFETGTPQRRLEGLKYLARHREEMIMSLLGSSIDDLVEQIMAVGSADVHPRRVRSLVAAAEDAGLRVEVVSAVRLVGKPLKRPEPQAEPEAKPEKRLEEAPPAP